MRTKQEMLSATKFIVRATHEEFMGIWRTYSKDAMFRSELNKETFGHESMGFSITVGEFHGYPVNIDIWWNTINGSLVMFYDDISRVVDHDMIRDWINRTLPNVPTCNATNFHIWLQFTKGS